MINRFTLVLGVFLLEGIAAEWQVTGAEHGIARTTGAHPVTSQMRHASRVRMSGSVVVLVLRTGTHQRIRTWKIKKSEKNVITIIPTFHLRYNLAQKLLQIRHTVKTTRNFKKCGLKKKKGKKFIGHGTSFLMLLHCSVHTACLTKATMYII